MRTNALAVLAASLLLPACKQGDPQPLEALPPAEHCAVEDSLVTPLVTSAQVGRMVNGAFQPFTAGAEVEVMPYSFDTWLGVATFVAPVAIRLTPPASVTEASLCGATGLVPDTFSNYVFHRSGAFLLAEGVLLITTFDRDPVGALSASVFFPLGNRTFRADTPALTVTFVNREGLGLEP